MLNRRLLRIKVMQTLYGLKQSEKSDFYLSLDFIADVFAPDLNSMEPRDPEELRVNKKLASDLFYQSFTNDKPNLFQYSDEIRKSVDDAKTLYEKYVKRDKKHFESIMMEEINIIYENYVLALRFIVDLVDYAEVFEEDKKNKHIKGNSDLPPVKNLLNNTLYKMLKFDEGLQMQLKRGNLKWEQEEIRNTFKSDFKNSEELKTYLALDKPDFEEDRKFLLFTAKNYIFKNKSIQGFFEERDFNWTENQGVVKSLVSKTLKTAEIDSDRLLIDISGNWDEDKQFFEDLFQDTLTKGEELDQYIVEKAQNWDMDRIAMTDSIILKMALTEMITCPGIPVKVSINEYIELSKLYSTPKSKQFINGMLDAISQELIKKGVIRKSGRGLIDNK
jgi:N utilization substance protein B